MQEYLFEKYELGESLRNIETGIPQEVDTIPEGQFLEASDEQIVEHLESRLRIEPITLYEDKATMEDYETKVDVAGDRQRYIREHGPFYIPGREVKIYIPYTGDKKLWHTRPSSHFMVLPTGYAEENQLIITIVKPHDANKGSFKEEFDRNMDLIKKYLENQKQEIDPFNYQLKQKIENAVKARRERIERHSGLTKVIGIPLRRKNGVPDIEKIKLERNIIKPLPKPSRKGSQPEPGITEQQYEDILSLIRHQGRSFEQAPKTYAIHDEEELRNIMLANLNSIYQGEANSEAFRAAGKTDIKIEAKDRSAFVAEGKVWTGSKRAGEAIDQLLSYTTWRDCKSALIMFNKNVANFSDIQVKLPAALQRHKLYKREISCQYQGEWRYIFRSQDDDNKEITVHVFLFNMYAGK
jgi:hypothetical protein